MIDSCHGLLEEAGTDPLNGEAYAVLQVGSKEFGYLAYRLSLTQRTLQQLPALGEAVTLKTRLLVREDAHQLIGFLSRPERDVFNLLLSASGVGLRVALALLDALSIAELMEAILDGHYKVLTAAKGVGPKLAQKVVLELKEKMSTWQEHAASGLGQASNSNTFQPSSGPLTLNPQAQHEAEAVLLSLGYSPAEVTQSFIVLNSKDSATTWDSEALLREALRWLAHNS